MKMNLDSLYFDLIQSGKKIYETRVYDKKRQEIQLLEKVTFVDRANPERSFQAYITELSYFKDFKSAIEEVGIKKVLPNAKSLKEGVELYH